MEYYAYTYKSDKAFIHRIFWCIITLDVQIKCTIFNPLSAETKLALLPISSSSKKKEKSRSFPLRSNESSSRIHGTLADRARSYATRQVGHERATIPTPEGRLSRRYRDYIEIRGWYLWIAGQRPFLPRIFQKLADPRDPARRYAHNGAGATAYRFIVVAQFALARRRPSERESSVFLFFSFPSLFLFSLPSLPSRTRLE